MLILIEGYLYKQQLTKFFNYEEIDKSLKIKTHFSIYCFNYFSVRPLNGVYPYIN